MIRNPVDQFGLCFETPLRLILRGCESFNHFDLILRSPSEARASRRMAASPNVLPWFETARCARLLAMRPVKRR